MLIQTCEPYIGGSVNDEGIFICCYEHDWELNLGFDPTVTDLINAQNEHFIETGALS